MLTPETFCKGDSTRSVFWDDYGFAVDCGRCNMTRIDCYSRHEYLLKENSSDR